MNKERHYLIINCWSSSIKYQVFKWYEWKDSVLDLIWKWLIEKLNLENYEIHHTKIKDDWMYIKTDFVFESKKEENDTFKNAFEKLWKLLYSDDQHLWILEKDQKIDAIWHRVVHWWEKFNTIVEITDDVEQEINNCIPLAPLHNPKNLLWITFSKELFSWVKQFALFDTAFHQTMTEDHFLYALPYEMYTNDKIRRYWFHWISYQCSFEKITQKYWENKKIIVCHLWNWASVTAIDNWKVIDTSTWYTPVEWLIMWSRTWDIDAWILVKLIKDWFSAEEIDTLINKKSWITWILWNWDFRTILEWLQHDEDSEIYKKSNLIYRMYLHRVVKYIWWYISLMNWVDIIAFTWWIWENVSKLRSDICNQFSYLWVQINELWNQKVDLSYWIDWITSPSSKVKVCVVKADEEKVIATEIHKILSN